MNHLRMCESVDQALNRHPRIIKSPPESLGTRLTVHRYTSRFYASGSVSPTQYHHGPEKLLDELKQIKVMQCLLDNPSMYLTELRNALFEASGRDVHLSTICRTVHRLGFIRQKLRKVALQRSEEKRAYRCGLNVNIKDGNTVSAMEAES